jgi:uncharacterized protein YciI
MKRKSLILLATFSLVSLSCKDEHKGHDNNIHITHQSDDGSGEHLNNDVDMNFNAQVKSLATKKKELTDAGFQIFDYTDTKTGDTILMQQYFMAFLKRGPRRSQDSVTAARLQEAHLAHLGRMYDEGYADISGPFGDDGNIRGITIYNVPTIEMADSLANLDPMVKAGRLVIEIRPWWTAKGFSLR